jgi:hypothetical protein
MVDHPIDARFSDPVPEELRPTPRRLVFWTMIVVVFALAVGGSFVVTQMMKGGSHFAFWSPSVEQPAANPG